VTVDTSRRLTASRSRMELVVLLCLAAIVAALMMREVFSFVRWRRSLSQRDRGEWAQTIRGLRER
jgi:hypothetical protein